MSALEDAIQKMVDERVERAIEAKLPEIIRALGIREADLSSEVGELVDAVEVAKLLSCDVSTPKKVKNAKAYVYNLARQELIPSVRISPKRVKFDLNAVRKVLATGGKAVPHSKSA
jgi:hypothetical protein